MAVDDTQVLRFDLATSGLTVLLLCGDEESSALELHDYIVGSDFEGEAWWRCHLVTSVAMLTAKERRDLGIEQDQYSMLRIEPTDSANAVGAARLVQAGPFDDLVFSQTGAPSPGKIRRVYFKGDKG
jgi:hypothetical protein